jgi:CheY-like chemotaxis protein
MTQYKILFVDEVDEDIRRFQRYVNKEDTDKAFSLVCLTPENTLDNFLNKIRDERFDAIITDLLLLRLNLLYLIFQLTLVTLLLHWISCFYNV